MILAVVLRVSSRLVFEYDSGSGFNSDSCYDVEHDLLWCITDCVFEFELDLDCDSEFEFDSAFSSGSDSELELDADMYFAAEFHFNFGLDGDSESTIVNGV